MFTIEFTHNGKRRQMVTDALTDEMARVSFWNIRKQSSGEFELHLDTLMRHPTTKEMEAEVARFRIANSLPPTPSEAEIARYAREVLTNPNAFIPDEDEDDDE